MSLGLGQRITFTLGALLVYRIGAYIPVPGIDPAVWERLFRGQSSGVLSIFPGNDAVRRLSIFALDIFPYISAAVVFQLLLLFSRARADSGPRRTGYRYVLGLTVTFAALQASGIALGLERISGLVLEPGWLFRISTVVSLIGGTFFLVWLSGLITARGIGNGLSLLLFAGIAAELPAGVAGLVDLARRGVRVYGLRHAHRGCGGGSGGLHRVHRTGPAQVPRSLRGLAGRRQRHRGWTVTCVPETQQCRLDAGLYRALAPLLCASDRRFCEPPGPSLVEVRRRAIFLQPSRVYDPGSCLDCLFVLALHGLFGRSQKGRRKANSVRRNSSRVVVRVS